MFALPDATGMEIPIFLAEFPARRRWGHRRYRKGKKMVGATGFELGGGVS